MPARREYAVGRTGDGVRLGQPQGLMTPIHGWRRPVDAASAMGLPRTHGACLEQSVTSTCCPHCLASIAPHSQVCPCCGAAIAPRHAVAVAREAVPGPQGIDCMAREIRHWVDDFARREWTIERIMTLGSQAVMPLRRYLASGAQTVPQGRLFAVAMLARIDSPEACAGLRDVLHGTALAELPASHHDAERQVKDAAMQALARRRYSLGAADLRYAVAHEHLPSAVILAGERGIGELAPILVAMLGDDVLERPAAYALEQLGDVGRSAVLAILPAWFESARDNVRDRLGVIRALMLLCRMPGETPPWIPARAWGDMHPAVRAAGALLADRGPGHVAVLVRGALSDGLPLALACRERLHGHGDAFVHAAIDVLGRNLEPDIYGNQHALSRAQIRWLAAECLKRAAVSADALDHVVSGMREDALIAALTGAVPVPPDVLRALGRHRSPQVRQMAEWRSGSDAGQEGGSPPRGCSARQRFWRPPVRRR